MLALKVHTDKEKNHAGAGTMRPQIRFAYARNFGDKRNWPLLHFHLE